MTRRRVALLGVLAVLLQAVLFGWHSHPLRFGNDGHWPSLSASGSGAPLSPAADEDECELCAALHYLTAAPGEFILAALPASTALPQPQPGTVRRDCSHQLSFRARAPPLA